MCKHIWCARMVQRHRPRWSVAEMSALSIQCCDWPTWLWRARTANHSTESRGLTFRLLSLLVPCFWTILDGVPNATLKRHLDGMNKHANGVKKLGRNPVLSLDMEKQIHDTIWNWSQCFWLNADRSDEISIWNCRDFRLSESLQCQEMYC